MTWRRPLNLADPRNCRACGGDGVCYDWRNRFGDPEFEECPSCLGSGQRIIQLMIQWFEVATYKVAPIATVFALGFCALLKGAR